MNIKNANVRIVSSNILVGKMLKKETVNYKSTRKRYVAQCYQMIYELL